MRIQTFLSSKFLNPLFYQFTLCGLFFKVFQTIRDALLFIIQPKIYNMLQYSIQCHRAGS